MSALPLPDDRFLNRELSWLAFNERVLDLARDPAVPLLERVKFLAIFAGNLDEFFMVRVASLRRRQAAGIAAVSPDGLTPREQLDAITSRAQELVQEHAMLFRDVVLPELVKKGIDILRWDEVEPADQAALTELFTEQVFPVLTPLAVDPAHPFPYISGLSLNLAVVLRDPADGSEHFARVKVPPVLPRFLGVGEEQFVPLEDVIGAHLDELFPGMEVVTTNTFRVTRNADLEVEEDEGDDLLQALERELQRRRFGPAVRLEVEPGTDDHVIELLVREIGMSASDVYVVPGPLDLRGLWAINALDRSDLKDPPFVPVTPARLAESESGQRRDIFAAIAAGDVLVHHPYESFATSVQAFVEAAASDPDVLAIKQTLYRTSGDSPVVDALIDAAEAGKQVVVLVEIKARFDEQANIRWARALEQAGCHVVYGLVGLKTHCKTALVVRQEGRTMRRYAHIGTGNYNPKTARLYEDLGLLTADPQITSDLADLFNHLTGYSRHTGYQSLLVAPHSVRAGLVSRIEREIEHHEAGLPAGITFKVNGLVDEQVVDWLYRASAAGVPVDLLVRGMCVVRPGVPGLSDTMRVRSIVGRFLEHSRVFRFRNADEDELWIGSADVMHRNLDRRVEALVQVRSRDAVHRLTEMLDLAFEPDIAAWELGATGRWTRTEGDLRDYQQVLLRRIQPGATAGA